MESHKIPWFQTTNRRGVEHLFWVRRTIVWMPQRRWRAWISTKKHSWVNWLPLNCWTKSNIIKPWLKNSLRMSAHVCACLRKVPGGTWISCHTCHEREARANAGGQELSIVIRANMTLRYTQSLNQCFNISKVDWNVKVKCNVPF